MNDVNWTVVAVHRDSDDEGCFAYTVGLGDRGLDELFIWDQPSHGDDPGDGYRLSCRDLQGVLDRIAQQRIAGAFGHTATMVHELDGGLTTATFSLGRRNPAADVGALMARSARVVTVRWTLTRQPIGPPTPLAQDLRPAYLAEYVEVARQCDPRVAVEGGHRPSHSPTFSPGQVFGPLTPLVRVHARVIAGTPFLQGLFEAMAMVETADPTSRVRTGTLHAVARRHGRTDELTRVERLAERVVTRMENRPDWPRLLRLETRRLAMAPADTEHAVRGVLLDGIVATLGAIALDDVLPDRIAVPSQVAWRWMLASQGGPMPSRWCADDEVVEHIRSLIADAVASSGLAAFVADVEDLADRHFSDGIGETLAAALVRGAIPPPLGRVLPDRISAWDAVGAMRALEGLVIILTAALTEPDSLSSEQRQAMERCVGRLDTPGEAA